MRVAAVLLGAIFYALALAPFDWPGFGWLALIPLLLAIRDQPVLGALRLGILYGYVFGWAATWSFAEAAARYFQLSLPVAVAALSIWYLVVVGLPFGCFAAGTSLLLRGTSGRLNLWLVPALYVSTELFRARAIGQPWALLGYTQHGVVGLIQIATCTGVYGVSFLMALWSTGIAHSYWRWRSGSRILPSLSPVIVCTTPAVFCVVVGLIVTARGLEDPEHTSPVALVQTNLAPALHWTRTYTAKQIATHAHATDAMVANVPPTLIVWPENAVPRYLETDPMVAAQLSALATRHRADLLFGGPRLEGGRVYNSARLITAAGRNGGAYDKQRLVLFAEETPLVSAGYSQPGDNPGEFSAGTRPGLLHSFVPLGISICHEIVHADLIADEVRNGAELLVNLANDGWLDVGYDAARGQHLAMAVFRAVETRRYVLRAATSGTSAIIDRYGRITGWLRADTAGVLLGTAAGARAITPYVLHGDLFAAICSIAAVTALGLRQLAFGWRRLRCQPVTA